MIHDLDLVLSLVRQPVVSVSAVGVPVLTPSPDIANARKHLGWEPRYSLRDALTYTVQHYVDAASP